MSKPTNEVQLIRFDWAIKTVLRDKANFDVLEGFLTALLNEDIVIEQIIESESNAEENLKFNRVDLLVHDSKGRKLIIEVQSGQETDYLKRLLFGTSKIIVDNIDLGDAYSEVVKVISISILYYNLGRGNDYVYKGTTEFFGIHDNKPLQVRKRVATKTSFRLIAKNVFPEYYLINIERFVDIINTPLDEWVYLLKHSSVPKEFHAKNIDKAALKLAVLKMDKEERRRYENYVKNIVIERDVLSTAKQEGIKEGMQKGEQQERFRIAKSLLDVINNDELLAAKTGLSVAEVRSLRLLK